MRKPTEKVYSTTMSRGSPVAGNISISRRSFLAVPLFLAACKFDRGMFEISGSTMGTYYKVSVVDAPGHINQSDVKEAVEKALALVNQHLSNWDPTSEISRFNANQTTDDVSISPMLAEVMDASMRVNRQSLGRFDTTITPLIEAWGFGVENAKNKRPSESALADAMGKSRHHNTLQLSRKALRKKNPQTEVFLSAIGKGFGADLVARALQSRGLENFLIEIGGDLYASGHNESNLPWQVGVETPSATSRGVMDVVGVKNLGMASSGDYRNYFEQDGIRYSHIIDPMTGNPIMHHTASATVLAKNAMLADAWATAMLTLGREEGMKVADENNIAVMFIDRDFADQSVRFKVTKNERFKSLQI